MLKGRENGCPWNETPRAAKGGQLEVLQAREISRPWNEILRQAAEVATSMC